MGDERLIAAFEGAGCPICAEAAGAGRRFLEGVLSEQANDVGFRPRLLAGGGFCARHTIVAGDVDRERTGGALASAILLQAVLRPRVAALAELRRGRWSSKRLTEATREAWDCPVCGHERRAVTDAVARSIEHAESDPLWREWVVGGAFCLAHLPDLLDRARQAGAELGDALLAAQLGRLADIDARLAAYQHHHAHDRRDQLSDDERRAVVEARVVLAGGEGT
jgi:hypothetical protein